MKKPDFETINPRSTNKGSVDSIICNIPNERKAKCSDCSLVTNSHPKLPFFEKTKKEMDQYYCGCWGWD